MMDLCRRAEDLSSRAEQRYMLTHTGFLTPTQQAELRQWSRHCPCQLVFHGGLEECERTVAFFLPSDCEAEDFFRVEDHIFAVEITASFGAPQHKDYLGAVLGLGIERDRIGDIFLKDNRGYLLCLDSARRLILEELSQVGRCSVGVKELPLGEIPSFAKETRPVAFTVKSLRLDAVVSGLFGVSRTVAAQQIRLGAAFLNYLPCTHPDAPVSAGDTLSLRGHGKGVLAEIGGTSRKGRIYIRGERFV